MKSCDKIPLQVSQIKISTTKAHVIYTGAPYNSTMSRLHDIAMTKSVGSGDIDVVHSKTT